MWEWLQTQLGFSVALAVFIILAFQGAVAYCIYFERKISAWAQDRYGPNRVGPWGLLQPLADGFKFVFKEETIPRHVDKLLYVLAPVMAVVVAFIGFAVIPWGGMWQTPTGNLLRVQVASLDIGLLYLLGVASMGVYGVVIGGWASNNKYSFYGAMRATAQMLSYEVPLGLCVLTVVLTMGTVRLEEMVLAQAQGIWNVWLHPVAFIVLFVCMLAEANRAPFDLAECEQELVGGFHTEYGGMKFAMFFMGEYTHMLTSSALLAVLFLGGWHLPLLPWAQPEATGPGAVAVKMGVMFLKMAAIIFVMMWVRWTLPRFRFDQLMRICWKGLIPMTLALVVLATALVYFRQQTSVFWTLTGNAVVIAAALVVAARSRIPITGRQSNMKPAGAAIIAAPGSNG